MRNLPNCKKQERRRRPLQSRPVSTRLAAVCIVFSVLFAACSPAPTETVLTSPTELPLTPFQLSTSTPSPTTASTGLEVIREPSATMRPLPSPTPLTYEVKQGDTMLAIALRYGVSLEAMQEANPDVDPNFLSVGTVLKVPAGQPGAALGTATEIPTVTPVTMEVDPPRCYPAGDGGFWCFAALHNNQTYAVEGVSGWIEAAGESGSGEIHAKEASLPLNVLPPGEVLPLMVYFSADEVEDARELAGVSARLLTALPVNPGDLRYLPVGASDLQVEIDPEGRSAWIEGRIEHLAPTATLPPPTATLTPTITSTATGTVTPAPILPPLPPSATPTPCLTATPAPERQTEQVWVAAIAYGPEDEIVGVRKWDLIVSLATGEETTFEGEVYSAGPPIERIEVLLEAQ